MWARSPDLQLSCEFLAYFSRNLTSTLPFGLQELSIRSLGPLHIASQVRRVLTQQLNRPRSDPPKDNLRGYQLSRCPQTLARHGLAVPGKRTGASPRSALTKTGKWKPSLACLSSPGLWRLGIDINWLSNSETRAPKHTSYWQGSSLHQHGPSHPPCSPRLGGSDAPEREAELET